MNLLKNKRVIIIGLFFFFLILGYLVPMIADDWFWATYYGEWQVQEHFRELNGRYLGNLLIVSISRNRIARMIIFSIIMTISTYLLGIIKNNKYKNILLSFLLILTMSINVLKEAVLWISGFANYATSGLSLIILFYYIYHNNEFNNTFKRIFIFIFGIASCLFLENVSILHLIVSIILNIYYFYKEKKIRMEYLLYFIACLIGNIIMFTNPSYGLIINNDFDQAPKAFSINDIFNHLFNLILPELIYRNPIYLFLLTSQLKKHLKNDKRNFLLSIHPYLSIIYTLYTLIFNSNIYLNYLVSFLAILVIIEFVIYVFNKKDDFLSLLTISVVILTGPLLFINPPEYRTIYPSHLVMIIILLYLSDEINIKDKAIYPALSTIMIIFMLIYTFNYYGERQRKYHILNHKEDEVIKIPYLPLNRFVTKEEIDVREYQNKYSEFLNLKREPEYELYDYFDWLKIR